THRLLLLRHGQVPPHRGDVAVTDRGLEGAERLGRRLAATAGRLRVLTGGALRAPPTRAPLAARGGAGRGRRAPRAASPGSRSRSATRTSTSPASGSRWSAAPPPWPGRCPACPSPRRSPRR